MQYLGIDVHSQASVWCLLGEDGEIRARGKVETSVPALGELVAELSREGELRVAQEVGTMAYLVHDAVAGVGVEILSFNAQQLRMIASSRKKTDRRGEVPVEIVLVDRLATGGSTAPTAARSPPSR